MSTNLAADAPEPTDAGLLLVVPGRKRPASAGWDWVARGWTLFRMAPVMWMVAIVAVFVISLVMSLVPILGNLVYMAMSPLVSAGFVAACRALEREGEFDIEHLLAGFSRRFARLAVLGLLYILGVLLLLAAFALFAGSPILSVMMGGNPEQLAAAARSSLPWILLGLLVATLLALPMLAAYWFAPALVYVHGMSPTRALKASFGACFRNLGSFFVYSVVLLAGLIISMITLGLGLLVLMPLAITSGYAAYREIFTDDEAATIEAARPAVPTA
jgi:uncharacterized membrane protein